MARDVQRPLWSRRALKRVFVFSACLAVLGMGRPAAPEAPVHLRVGVLPDEALPRLREVYDPLLAYLTRATGFSFELEIPEDYDALSDSFDAGRLDLAWFGGLTFARAWQRSNARALASRDSDVRFTTAFIVPGDAEGRGVESSAGGVLAFGPRLSTSGHLMPRAFLDDRDIRPESFYAEVRYSQGHDQTVAWVRDGVVDIGAVNGRTLFGMIRSGRVGKDEVRILATTPPYQNYVWATPARLDPAVRTSLLEALLALDPADPGHAALLAELGGGGFLPVSSEDYIELLQVARRSGLLGAD